MWRLERRASSGTVESVKVISFLEAINEGSVLLLSSIIWTACQVGNNANATGSHGPKEECSGVLPKEVAGEPLWAVCLRVAVGFLTVFS